MSWKNTAQHSFADAMLVKHKCLNELDDVHKIINWQRITKMLKNLYSARVGAPAYPPLVLFKALLLQAWYDLSDEALEKQLARDLMFRKFINLSITEPVPDHSTLWRFRNLLHKKKLLTPMLDEINNHLARKSIIVTSGSIDIVDATVIEAKQSRPKKGKDGNNTQDKEAAYNVKTGSDGKRKTTYGYKLHCNTDEDGFIKKTTFTKGSTHDSQELDKLMTKKSTGVYADSAYASKKNKEKLKDRYKILNRKYRNKPLTKQEKQQNKQITSIRYVVERTFGLLKLHMGLGKARYMGINRNHTRAQLIAMAHNIKSGIRIYQDMQRLKLQPVPIYV